MTNPLTFRFPASLTDKVRWAIQGVLDDHASLKLPGFAYGSDVGEMEVVIRSLEPVTFDLDQFRTIRSGESTEAPVAADGVAEESDEA